MGDLLEDPGDLLDCDPGTRMDGPVVPVVTDVLVRPRHSKARLCQLERCRCKRKWSVREGTFIARMENYLNKSDCLTLETEELELLMGPEDSEDSEVANKSCLQTNQGSISCALRD